MAYKSFIPITPSARAAGVGFLPVIKSALIEQGEATTVLPAIISLRGSWQAPDQINVNINTDAPSGGTPVAFAPSERITSEEMAVILAASLDAFDNTAAQAVGNKVEVLANDLATTLTINSVVIGP